MRKKIIEKLKSNNSFRNTLKTLKKTWNVFGRLRKREPHLIFHSPRVALTRSRRPFFPGNKAREKIIEIENNLIKGISIFKDVISYPLKKGIENDYSGGLVDSKTLTLIKEGMHLRVTAKFTQELQLDDYLVTEKDLPEIRHVVLFAGILYNHFGHFLLESLGRLWAYDYVKELDPYILFYNDMGDPNYLEKNNFIYKVFAGFNIPHEKVIFIDFTVKLKQVIIPIQKYGYDLCKNPDEIFLKFIRSFSFSPDIPKKFKKADKIYVSRSKMAMGKMIGETYFEKYLCNEGYSIFHPELYSLDQQLSIYNNVTKIIFCDGAALHACILLPDLKADISVIARRRDRRWPCRNILDQFHGFHKKVFWIDCIKDQYQFGLESWLALSIADWFEVSKTLKNEGFVGNLWQDFHEIDFSSLVRSELRNFITTISNMPEFIDFLIQCKEELPAV